MQFATEHKVFHHEWDEVTVPAREFFMLFEGWFREDDEGEGRLDAYDYTVTMNFENGTMEGDEMWGVRDGRAWTSSNASGIMGWHDDASQYVKQFYGRATELGALESVTFTLDDALREALNQLSS